MGNPKTEMLKLALLVASTCECCGQDGGLAELLDPNYQRATVWGVEGRDGRWFLLDSAEFHKLGKKSRDTIEAIALYRSGERVLIERLTGPNRVTTNGSDVVIATASTILGERAR